MSAEDKQDVKMDDWMNMISGRHVGRAEMNRLVMNYLEKEGFKEAAEKFRLEANIQPKLDLDTLDHRIKIRDCIQNGQIDSAIALVNDVHPELLDKDMHLYFHLLQQQVIELIRLGDMKGAVFFAQERLAERADSDEEIRGELERTLALLAFDDPANSPFGDLLQPSHRQKVASELNAKMLQVEGQNPTPKLCNLVRLLSWTQGQLDLKKVRYPKMTDIAKGSVEQ